MFHIPLEAIFQTEDFMRPLGGHMATCGACRQLQPHWLLRHTRRDVILLVPRQEQEVGKVSCCEVCHAEIRHPAKREIHAIERWSSAIDLRDFARRAGGEPLPADHRLITATSAEALLRSVTAKGAASMDLTWKDYLIAIGVLLLSAMLALVLSCVIDSEEYSMWILLGVTFGGLFLALGFLGLTQHRRRAKDHHLMELAARLAHLGVPVQELLAVMPQQLLTNERVYTLMRSFM